MAQIDAHFKTTSNGDAVVATVDDINNNDTNVHHQKDDIDDLADKMEHHQLNNHKDDETMSKVSTMTSESNTSLVSGHHESFSELFKMFAKFGDSKSTGETITLFNSDKWFKQAKIIDPHNKTITTTDTGIYFKQVAKTKKSLTLKEYNQFLEKLATVKKIDFTELKNKLQSSGPPATNKTTTVVTSGAIGRLTDHTKYTGSHKQRFDESGKGRGKAGRVDIKSNTGYVSGFKATN